MIFSKNSKNLSLYCEIIRQLYYGKSLSAAELSQKVDKSVPLVTKALNALVQAGYVIDLGYAPSSGGRRPLMYAVKPNQQYIITVAMNQLSTSIGTVDLLNNYVMPIQTVNLNLQTDPDALNSLVGIINKHLDRLPFPKENILGIGIGMPGFIDINAGRNYTYLDSGDMSLTEYLSEATGLPAYIDNDSSLVALAELKFGAAKSKKDVMVINISRGIGLGMIINNQLFRGYSGFAGEFSHIAISEDGALCSCGKQGCLEAEASMLAVAKKAIEGIKNGRISSLQFANMDYSELAGDALMDAANKGDQFAIELISEAAYKIGRAISILIHIVNPQAIILSGKGVKIGRLLLAPIQQALNKYCIPRLVNGVEVSISAIGANAELTGSAILVMENLEDAITKSQPQLEKQH